MVLPCGLLGTITSAINTVELFVSPNLLEINAQFLVERNIYPPLQYVFCNSCDAWSWRAVIVCDCVCGCVCVCVCDRAFNQEQVIDPSLIKSGDYLAIGRFDGLDPMVMFGTGGRTGHSAVCVWDNGTLYVVESTDANPFGAVYWPPPYGIIRTPYTQWVKQAMNASYMVDLLPLSPEYADKFQEVTGGFLAALPCLAVWSRMYRCAGVCRRCFGRGSTL
jgi:hypothetical protein